MTSRPEIAADPIILRQSRALARDRPLAQNAAAALKKVGSPPDRAMDHANQEFFGEDVYYMFGTMTGERASEADERSLQVVEA